MGWNLGSIIWFRVAPEGSWLFGVLGTIHGSCSLNPGQPTFAARAMVALYKCQVMMESWPKDFIGVGTRGKLAVWSSKHHTWVMFVEPWPSKPWANFSSRGIRCPFQGLIIPHDTILSSTWYNLVDPCPAIQAMKQLNFFSMCIGCPLQKLNIPWNRILGHGFDWGWNWREIVCLEFLAPYMGHVCWTMTSYPSLVPTFASLALVAHCKI